jgi:homoserine O-acetyltransferase
MTHEALGIRTSRGGSIGLVETRTVRLYTEEKPLRLSSGETIGPVDVAYETYGSLDADGANAVVVCHALTGDAHAAGHHGDPEQVGWWDTMIGPGKPVDTDRLFVVGSNLLGGCKGTTGPSSIDPRTGRPYGLRFPHVSMSDLVTVQRALLRHLGVERLHGAIGGSLGGMQVLQWELDHPGEIANAVLPCASGRLTAQNIALSAVARASIMRDEHFQDGDYYGTGRTPDVGLAIARQLAHVTYVSEEALTRKFDRARRRDGPPSFDIDFEIESYLDHQGTKFLERFDANTYLYLSRVMDYFEPFADEEAAAALLARSHARWLLVSFTTDWRFPTSHSRELARVLRAAGKDATHEIVDSPWGHDSFLLPVPDYLEAVARFLA